MICNHKIGFGIGLYITQAIYKTFRNGNISFGRFGFKNRGDLCFAFGGPPCPSHRNIGCRFVKKNTVPLQSQDLFSAQTGIQTNHNEKRMGEAL